MALREQVRVEDLFPGARALFRATRRRPPLMLVLAITAAAGILLLMSVRLLHWLDYNL